MPKFVVTVRETTDHEIIIEAETSMDARCKAELVWREFEDGSFRPSIGPRQMFCRRTFKPTDRGLSVR